MVLTKKRAPKAAHTIVKAFDIKTVPQFTYADCLEWEEGLHPEIINGELIDMSAPTIKHQIISRELFGQLFIFLKKNPMGELLSTPIDVRLFPKPDHSDKFVVEPDIIVVKDRSKLDLRSCNGGPEFVIEILSPSTALKDKTTKLALYRQAGVLEYWIVNPDNSAVTVHLLQDEADLGTEYAAGTSIPVNVLSGCELVLK